MPNIVSCIFGWNSLDRAALGLLGAGERLARQMDAKHVVLLVGAGADALVADLSKFADSIHVAYHPLLGRYHIELTLSALAQALQPLEPAAVLLGNDSYSQELAPRLAHRLGGSAAGDALRIQVQDGSILVNRPVYGGKAEASIALRRSPGVVWLRTRAQAAAEPRAQA